MTPAHVHLLVNHVPILGTFFGLLVLAYGTFRGNKQIQGTAYLLFILSALGGVVAYLTGEGAEDLVEKIAGISENAIEAHEEAAVYSLIASIVLGLISAAGVFLGRIKTTYESRFAIAIGLVALFSFSVGARVGFLGGKIRHTELFEPQLQGPGAVEGAGEERD